MARKTHTRSTRARLEAWLEDADRLLTSMTFPTADYAKANNESRRAAR